jgi:DNA-binding SARP family transcriptional activator
MNRLETLVTIAADSVEKLRKQDVFGVLEWAPRADRSDLASWIIEQRTDLRDEVSSSLEELTS